MRLAMTACSDGLAERGSSSDPPTPKTDIIFHPNSFFLAVIGP